jgi:hypothetical protein
MPERMSPTSNGVSWHGSDIEMDQLFRSDDQPGGAGLQGPAGARDMLLPGLEESP